MTNRWIAMLGASVLVLGITACSDSADQAKPAASEQTTPQVTEPAEPVKQLANKPGKNANKENQDTSITALVNKQHSLDKTYEPTDLVTVDVPTALENPEINQLRKAAADALKEMFSKAKEADIKLYARSGYRSYKTQEALFKNYSAKNGKEAANRYSAKPGQSEHQTGLVMDVTSESVNLQLTEDFGETEEGKWISKHAHEFGFIIRYPKDKENITGYIYEPWHLRYLGIDLATEVYQSGLTYEEFLSEENIEHAIN